MDAIEPSNYEQAGWSDMTYEYVQALRASLAAETARADAAEAERDQIRQWWETAIEERDFYSQERDAAEQLVAKYGAALKAIIARWDTPQWKDAPATGEVINAARSLIKEPKA